MSDFRYATIADTAHRPWPMPRRPWVMTQTWHDLLFAHWPVDVDALRRRVPTQLPLDLYEGRAWIGVVPFHMTNVSPRLVPPLPWLSAFPEINVRTYVTVGGRPGVYFFSLDATNPIAVWSARAVFGLRYFTAAIDVRRDNDAVRYRSRRSSGEAVFEAEYAPTGDPFVAQPGTLEYFLTERYCLYTVSGSGRIARAEIHHAPWSLRPAAAEIRTNTMAVPAGIALPAAAPHLLFVKRQDTIAWLPAGSAV